MLSFYAHGFEVVPDGDIRRNVETLRAISAAWKEREDPLADLEAVRTGERLQ
jgi:hypothetical protein